MGCKEKRENSREKKYNNENNVLISQGCTDS